MQTRHTDAIPLAPRPSLEQYKTLAKDLVKASRSGDVEHIRTWSTDWIERLARLQSTAPTPEFVEDNEPRHLDWKRIERTVDGILHGVRQSGLLASDTRSAEPTLAEAQLVIARLHGFDSWPKFAHHIEARDNASTPVSQFESAADAIVTGDSSTLDALLRENPSLVHARSTREHRATLLHYVAANGHEGFRQRTPQNAVEIARILLEAGAGADALAEMYGHRCTTMEMLVSSVHPHAAGVQVALVDTLLDFGALVNGVENNGSPLMTAFRFHYPKAAAALVRRGARVDNVISAAAVGRLDLVDAFVDERGLLRPDVPLADVPWPHLPRDPAVHLGYALTWGATFGPPEVVELLLRKGVDPSGRDDDATALHFAAAYGRMDLVRLLLNYGASLETRNSYDGTVLSGTLWYAYNAPIEGVDYPAIIRELIELGARVDVYPQMQENVNAILAGLRRG